MAKPKTADEKWEEYVNTEGPLVDGMDTPCHIWRKNINSRGYGECSIKVVLAHFNIVGQTRVMAHRISWMRAHGPIPDGMQVNHLCNNPPCVNPDHLELGTQSRNVRYMMDCGRGRKQFGNYSPIRHKSRKRNNRGNPTTSEHPNVSYDKSENRWRVTMQDSTRAIKYRSHHKTEDEAIRHQITKAREYNKLGCNFRTS